MRKRMTAALLSLALALSPLLSGCGGPPRLQARDLMAEVPAPKVPVDTQMTEDSAAAVMDFCVRLFQEGGVEGENVLISPVSVLYALAMAANGAQGDTLEQMEAVLGLPLLELNEFCRAWLAALPEEDGALSIANSLWFRDSEMLTVEESFLEANALWYGADVYEAPFDDATVSDVNAWVDYHTGGTIPVILEEIPENAMVYLVNALAFDGRWETPYREDQVRAGTFTREDGTVREAELMYSTEDWYLSDGKAQGFLKYYEGCDYAFAALLPPEGVPLADYIASLGAKTLFARHPPCSVCRKSLAEFCRPQAAKEKSTARFPPRGTAAAAYAANMPPACLLTLRRRKNTLREASVADSARDRDASAADPLWRKRRQPFSTVFARHPPCSGDQI